MHLLWHENIRPALLVLGNWPKMFPHAVERQRDSIWARLSRWHSILFLFGSSVGGLAGMDGDVHAPLS